MKFFKTKRNWGILLLGIWLIITGLVLLVPRISFSHSEEVVAVLAIVTGVLLLLGK